MDTDFWLSRWDKCEIGFHQVEINRFLEQYWPSLKLAKDSTVLVPLCGKSRDIRWLAELGHHVLGVEISEKAVQEFFEEWLVQPKVDQKDSFTCYSGGNVEILVGDFFLSLPKICKRLQACMIERLWLPCHRTCAVTM